MDDRQGHKDLEARTAVLQAAKELSSDFNAKLSEMLGYRVKFIVCGNRRFMLSASGDKAAELKALAAKLAGVTVIGSEYDENNDCTFCLFLGRATRTAKEVFSGGKSNG